MPPITQRGLQVPFTEFPVRDWNTPRFSVDPRAQSATRSFKVAWGDAVLACQQLVGYSTLDTTNPHRPRIRRWLPAQFPMIPWLVCRKAEVVGFGKQGFNQTIDPYGKIAVYPEAIIQAQYESVPFDLLMDSDLENTDLFPDGYSEFNRYMEPKDRQSGKTLSYPANVMRWGEGSNGPNPPGGPPPHGFVGQSKPGSPFPGSAPKIECSREHHFRLLDWPLDAYPKTAIKNSVGHVNASEFNGAPPHTLLLLSADRERVNNPLGGRSWEIEYAIASFEPGHNDLFDFRAAVRDYYQVSFDGYHHDEGFVDDGTLIFDEVEFADLFVPEPG